MILIPPRWRNKTIWIDGTPHLSRAAAERHRVLASAKVEEPKSLRTWLRHTAYANAVSQFDSIGEEQAVRKLLSVSQDARKRLARTREMLLEEQKQARRNPLLTDEEALKEFIKLREYLDGSREWASPQLLAFEFKTLAKYASDSDRRFYEEYYRAVKENYLPSREHWQNKQLPHLSEYNAAVEATRQLILDNTPWDLETDFISLARKSTYGGAPYYINMGEFLDVDDDENDTTYADLYNKLAVWWLLMTPKNKERVIGAYQYTALERVQHGGISLSAALELQTIEQLNAAMPEYNKQRFIQAESAVLSHAMKILHDNMLASLRRTIPEIIADKISEEYVTARIVAFGHEFLDDPDSRLQGADWSNYDADIETPQLNDNLFDTMRSQAPAGWSTWIIDPYIRSAWQMKISVPGMGVIQTTGVKSGMEFTNMGDTVNAITIDAYEMLRGGIL